MKQTQKIGHQSQEQDVKSVKHKAHIHHAPAPTMKVDEKPAITNDKGQVVDKHQTDAGKGYNEEKPTDPGADHLVAQPHEPEMAEVPFEGDEDSQHKHAREEQDKHEDEDHFKKRTKQAEDVRG